MVEGRVVFEKIRLLETKMRYQIDKLVSIAESEDTADIVEGNTENCTLSPRSHSLTDPLAYRPDPHNLLTHDEEVEDTVDESVCNDHFYQEKRGISDVDAIYRPPRVAPAPYTEKSNSKRRKEHILVPSALASLSSDASRPHVESTSGLGSTPSLVSGRAAYLKRLNEFEEDNLSRVVMKKSDAKRRDRDEADLALGGSLTGGGKHRRRAGRLDDEFSDVLRSVQRVSSGGFGTRMGDGYDELRHKSKKVHFLGRSRQEGSQKRTRTGEEEVFGHARKRSRFEVEAKNMKKKLGRN
ncbi:hypothetical protein C0992_005725 [Termitomyces sp. T32_za158]|nr:hypothetical protein C0992_005725 [Termitomyces sp. T32_za158]